MRIIFRLLVSIIILLLILVLVSPANSQIVNSNDYQKQTLERSDIQITLQEKPHDESLSEVSSWSRDKDGNRVDDRIDQRIRSGSYETVNLYINYHTPPNQKDVDRLEEFGINISYRAKYIPTICAREVPLDKIKQLSQIPNLVMIELQPYLVPALDVSARSVKARDSTEYSPETAWELEYTGRGITIAILDSGIDNRHESLDGKFEAGYDTTLRVPREGDPDDEDGHGTHVAGIALGTGGSEGQYIGIAPDARLVDVKVLSDWGLSSGDQVIMGIEWCIENKDQHGIDILSLSVGELFTGNEDGTNRQGQLVNEAVAAGLVVVVAAGNDGEKGFSSLAAADGAITVGSIDEIESVTRVDDVISDFSNYGPRKHDSDEDKVDELKPDVVAPGEDIMSALFSASPAGILTGYQQLTGTSMACPHVAGLVALILEANPDLTPEQVKDVLHKSSEAVDNPTHGDIDPKYNKYYGWGMVDAYEAVKEALGADYQTVYFLSHEDYDEVYNIVTIYGTASMNKGEIETVEYNINGGPWQLIEGTDEWEFEWDTTSVDNGLNYVYVRSNDGIEYSNQFALKLNVVNIGAKITEPVNGSTVSGEYQIKGTSFGTDISRVMLKLGEDDWVRVASANDDGNLSRWEYSWDTNDMKNGRITLLVKAYNDDWYSIPTFIEVEIKNDKPSKPSGFLPGFEAGLIITCVILILVMGYNKKRKR